MARRIALLLVVFPPILAILWDAYPTLGDPFWLFYATPLYVFAVDFYLRTGRFTRTVLRQRAGLALLCCLITASVILTHWPLHLSFLAAKPALERMALSKPDNCGHYGDDPGDMMREHVGTFVIEGVCRPWNFSPHSKLEYMRFRLQPLPWFASTTALYPKGFIYSPGGYVPAYLAVDINLGDGWHYIVED
jgi:hypothetical protein